MANSNTRIVLASHPSGEPTEADFRIETVPVPDPDDGQVLIRTIHLSLDGYIDRGSKSCTPRHQLSGSVDRPDGLGLDSEELSLTSSGRAVGRVRGIAFAGTENADKRGWRGTDRAD